MATTSSSARARFDAYVERLGAALGHADRRAPLRAYLTGLLLEGGRKSVEPMAALVDPRHVSARHQSMHHFVAASAWDDAELLGVAVDHALEQFDRHAPVGAWVVDDTGYPKKGRHSVGVGRQYCGVLGKQDNCQVAVSVSLVSETMSMPAAYRLYLPKAWAEDPARCAAAGVPADVVFQEKWRIALSEIARMREEDELPAAPVVADAGYGDVTAFREGLGELGLSYAVGIKPETTLWPPGEGPRRPRRGASRKGPVPTRLRRDAAHRPSSARELALALPTRAWKTVKWREGTKGRMRSRFARLRVRAAHRDTLRDEPRPEEWLLVEWPAGMAEPTKYWLSTVPDDVDLDDLVRLAKIRWRIERDYQELKDELGIDHYEGRGWRGFHHHGMLCIAAYAFLIAERARLSPPSSSCLPPRTCSTRRLPPARRCPFEPCVITPRPSRRSASRSNVTWSKPCRAVRPAADRRTL
jgi:SRSO17 transposase